MAKSLLETIQKNLQAGPAQPQATETDQTGQLQQLLRTKASGRAAGGRGPRISNIQEQTAQQQARLGQQQLQTQQDIATQQFGEREADITQRGQQQQTEFETNRQVVKDRFTRETDNILQEYTRGFKKIESARDIARLEQAGFMIRLQSEQYINQLQMEGERARLDSDIEFKTQAAKDALSEQMAIFKDDLAFKRTVEMTEREFAEEISTIDINTALEIAENAIKAGQQRMIAQGAGSAVSGGLQTAAASGLFKNSGTPETLTTGYQAGQGPEGSTTRFGGPR